MVFLTAGKQQPSLAKQLAFNAKLPFKLICITILWHMYNRNIVYIWTNKQFFLPNENENDTVNVCNVDNKKCWFDFF